MIEKYKHQLRRISLYSGLVLYFAALLAIAYLEITNTDMTKIRLFMTYWKEYLAIVAVMLGATYLMVKGQ